MEKISPSQAAKLLGVSIDHLGILEKQGLIHTTHDAEGVRFYSSSEIARIKSRRSPTLTEEATQVGIGIQREMASFVAFTRKVLILAAGALSGYVLLVALFTALFIVNPLQTAQWLGIVETKTSDSVTQGVLGAETSVIQERISPIQTFLQPIGKASLGLVKNISPDSYTQVSKVAILDPNDVLGLDTSGAIIPERPINLPESSLLQVGSSGLVENLNSQYLQGRQPGTNPGDIALVENTTPSIITATGSNTISGLTISNFGSANISQWTNDAGFIIASSTDTLSNKTIDVGSNTISGITNLNLSGSAGITNANLANSSFETRGNSGSGSAALGGSLTFIGSGITNVAASGSTLTFTSTEVDTLQSAYDRGNTITTTTGNGIIVDSSGATVVGTINGLKINAPTTIPATGTYNSLNLGTSTSSTANSYDQATITVGNLASTAQQNFSTLNITNGGTGFLDVELIRGFINFQGTNTLYDDFTSKSLNTADRWTSTSTGAGSNCSILAGGLNGLFRMHSGAGTNRGCELTTQAIGALTNGYYQRGNNPIFETKLKINTVNNARIFAGFTDTRVATTGETNASTNHAYIAKKAADNTWQCVTDDGGAIETTTDTGVTIVANTFYRLRVELRSGTTPETICTIDDGTIVTRTVVTATQPSLTNPMDVYLKNNQSDTVAKNMDVDYVRAWQDDQIETDLAIDTEKVPQDEMSPPETPTLEEDVVSDPGNFVELVADFVNNLFKNLVEFFGNVIFHDDVTFLGRPMFNKDTAGHAFIKTGSNEVSVIFEKEYAQNPVVTASVNLADGVKMDEIPAYAIYDLSTKGFKIKLSKVTTFDLNFSWVALFVPDNNEPDHSVLNTP